MKYLFEVQIRDGHTAEEYAQAWVEASAIIQQAPGARGTALHRKLDDPNVLLAIAEWDSKAARDAMEAEYGVRAMSIIKGASHLCDIVPIGEFDEPEWVVPLGSDAES